MCDVTRCSHVAAMVPGMAITNLIKRDEYRDSVILMKASEALQGVGGVLEAALMMGTESNRQILSRTGLLTEKGQQANAGDLIVAVQAVSEGHANIGVPGVVLQVQNGKAVSVFPPEAAGGEIWYPMPAWDER
jgi:FdrA protein